jgi:predicted MFS family arabinose efflux permease
MRPAMSPAARIFLVFAAGYFLSYLFRTVNAVLAPDLVATFELSAADLGLMTALYFLSFAGMQPALGILLDRHGPRRVQSALLIVAALGAGLFAAAESRATLLVARTLIGLGVAGCLMAALKATVLWFPKERLPLVNGGILTAGGLGAVVAATPVELMAASAGWRVVFASLAGATLATAAATWLAAPEPRPQGSAETLAQQLGGIAEVYRTHIFRRLAPAFSANQGAWFALHGLWAGAWLREAAGLDRLTVSYHQVAMSVALTAGFLSSGVIAQGLSRRGVPTISVAGWGMSGLVAVEAAIALAPPARTVWLWSAASFLAAFMAVGFAALNQAVPSRLAARANTSMNLFMFSLAFSLQYAFGALLELWPAGADGMRPLEAWRCALGAFILVQTASVLWFWAYRRNALRHSQRALD